MLDAFLPVLAVLCLDVVAVPLATCSASRWKATTCSPARAEVEGHLLAAVEAVNLETAVATCSAVAVALAAVEVDAHHLLAALAGQLLGGELAAVAVARASTCSPRRRCRRGFGGGGLLGGGQLLAVLDARQFLGAAVAGARRALPRRGSSLVVMAGLLSG